MDIIPKQVLMATVLTQFGSLLINELGIIHHLLNQQRILLKQVCLQKQNKCKEPHLKVERLFIPVVMELRKH